MTEFPGVLGEIADVAGAQIAMLIADQLGGQEIWIPADLDQARWLVDLVGEDAAREICEHFAVINADGRRQSSGFIVVPRGPGSLMAKARRRAMTALVGGATAREAARQSGLHERTIWRIKRRLDDRRKAAQLDLFG